MIFISIYFGIISTIIISYYWYSIIFRDSFMKEVNVNYQKTKQLRKQFTLLFELTKRFFQSNVIAIFYNTLKKKDDSYLSLALSLAVFFCVSFQLQYYTSKVV